VVKKIVEGETFNGQFVADRREGYGEGTFNNMKVESYRGEWRDNKPMGLGAVTGKNGDIFVGMN